MPLRKLVVSPDARESTDLLGALLESPPAERETIKEERRTHVWKARLPGRDMVVVKTYRHRSAYDFARESLSRFRAEREFEALSFLEGSDIPCTRPACWACGRDEVSGRFESLVTFEEPDTVGLKSWLRSDQADDRWVEPVARLLRRAHDAGFYHGALVPRNILLRLAPEQAPGCLFVDTPKSIVFRAPIAGTRMARHDLMTLLGEACRVAGDEMLAPFLAAYGEDAAAIPTLAEASRRYRPTRNTRNRMRAEFLFRRLLG
jgi:tRNA A-37 threonylcarbamoyl transferase component Bud32